MMTAAELRKLSKYELARQHVLNGGIMGLNYYLTWKKDELVNTVLEDQERGAK
jgi:hypothetical protein